MASFYSPKEYKDWQKQAASLLSKVEAPAAPFEGPLEVEVLIFAERPKTTKLPHPKPDIDNYVKAVLDAITVDGRFWSDDTQVAHLVATKSWHESGQIEVRIRPL